MKRDALPRMQRLNTKTGQDMPIKSGSLNHSFLHFYLTIESEFREALKHRTQLPTTLKKRAKEKKL
jgi:hypothetical protein